MPLSGGTAGAHDDAMHQGSSKRDVANGVAGIDGDGRVLAPGPAFSLTRDVADQLGFRERTSSEDFMYVKRDGADDYTAYILDGGSYYVLQHAGLKDIAGGIAALDAGGDLLAQGPDLHLVRDGSENIELIERTSGEIVARFTRLGVDDYEFRMHCGTVACVIQNDSMKDVANGIAGLDASAEVPLGHLKMDVANGIAGLNADIEVPLALMPRKYDLSLTDADQNITGDQLVSIFPFRMTPSANRQFILPTAAAVYNEIPGALNRTTFMFSVTSLAAFNVTVTTNTGFTLYGSMVVNNGSGLFAVIISDLNSAFLYRVA